MNFINDRELARRFKEDAVPSRERLYYILIWAAFGGVFSSSYVMDIIHTSANKWDVSLDIIYGIGTLLGTILLYNTNSNGDNREFIERFTCIGFPVFIQATLLLFVVLTVSYSFTEITDETSVIDVVLISLSLLYFFFRLNQSIKIASH